MKEETEEAEKKYPKMFCVFCEKHTPHELKFESKTKESFECKDCGAIRTDQKKKKVQSKKLTRKRFEKLVEQGLMWGTYEEYEYRYDFENLLKYLWKFRTKHKDRIILEFDKETIYLEKINGKKWMKFYVRVES